MHHQVLVRVPHGIAHLAGKSSSRRAHRQARGRPERDRFAPPRILHHQNGGRRRSRRRRAAGDVLVREVGQDLRSAAESGRTWERTCSGPLHELDRERAFGTGRRRGPLRTRRPCRHADEPDDLVGPDALAVRAVRRTPDERAVEWSRVCACAARRDPTSFASPGRRPPAPRGMRRGAPAGTSSAARTARARFAGGSRDRSRVPRPVPAPGPGRRARTASRRLTVAGRCRAPRRPR